MKNLKTLSKKLPKSAAISKEELSDIIGGRRYETRSYFAAVSVCQQLWMLGRQYTVAQHDGKYCIEW